MLPVILSVSVLKNNRSPFTVKRITVPKLWPIGSVGITSWDLTGLNHPFVQTKTEADVFRVRLNKLFWKKENNTQTGSFYSILHDQVYFLPMAFLHQEDCDLLYYFDPIETDAHTIASPGANIDASVYNSNEAPMYWEIRRTIRFEKQSDLTEETFLQCTNDSLILARTFVFGTGKRKAKNLDTGHIYSFVSEAGQKGMFLVTALEGTESGSIQITLKIQKP